MALDNFERAALVLILLASMITMVMVGVNINRSAIENNETTIVNPPAAIHVSAPQMAQSAASQVAPQVHVAAPQVHVAAPNVTVAAPNITVEQPTIEVHNWSTEPDVDGFD